VFNTKLPAKVAYLKNYGRDDHGHIDHGDKSLRIWSGDANANCPPPQILSYKYKKSAL